MSSQGHQEPVFSPAGKRVLVKPLSFNSSGPLRVMASTNGAASSHAPASGLAELATQLTPAQAQTIDQLLHNVKQLTIPTSLHPSVASVAKNKPLMPKAVAPLMVPALPVQQKVPVPVSAAITPSSLPPPPVLPSQESIHPPPPPPPPIRTNKPRKPCHCKNSQCLKLYCDCFANGEFCRDGCQCLNCKNNVSHSEERARAVKICLDRNPHAFKPKVGPNKSGDMRRHVKGCNCKRSGCLKNYCECYEAKIPCSGLCRCIGCRNLPDKSESKSLMHLADAADIRTQQQAAASHLLDSWDYSSTSELISHSDKQLPFSFINKEVSKATCLCLLEEASHAQMCGKSLDEVERAVIEEFGRCMRQIISSAQSAGNSRDKKRRSPVT